MKDYGTSDRIDNGMPDDHIPLRSDYVRRAWFIKHLQPPRLEPLAKTQEEAAEKWDRRQPMTIGEIAIGVGCNPKRIRTINDRAMRKIARVMKGLPPVPPKTRKSPTPRPKGQPVSRKKPRGANAKVGKYTLLTMGQVVNIKQRLRETPRPSYRQLAGEFNCNFSTIAQIAQGKTWGHVQ